MNEMTEQPPRIELQEHLLIKGTREAVKTGLEAHGAYKDWKNELRLVPGVFHVYETIDKARRNVLGVMTEADRRSMRARLYDLSMRAQAFGFQAVDTLLNVTSKVLFVGGIGLLVASPVLGAASGLILSNVGTGLLAGLSGAVAGAGVSFLGFVEGAGRKVLGEGIRRSVKSHEAWRKGIYKAKLYRKMGKELPRAFVEGVKQKTMDVLTGFAYRGGKPQPVVR